MKIGSFANKKFIVKNNKQITFNNLSRTSSLATETVSNGKKKPKTVIKNQELDSFSLTIPLRNRNVNVLKEIDSWRSIEAKAKPYYFLLGKKRFGRNKWLLVGVKDKLDEIGPNGIVRKATIELSFEECKKITKKKSSSKSSS